MAHIDSGGFDLGLHLALDALTDRIGAALTGPMADVSFDVPFRADPVVIHPVLNGVTDISVAPDATITLTCRMGELIDRVTGETTPGTTISWPGTLWNADCDPFGFTCDVSLKTTPTYADGVLALTFPADAVTVTIPPKALEGCSCILEWLTKFELTSKALLLLEDPFSKTWLGAIFDAAEKLLEPAREKLYADCTSAIATRISELLTALPTVSIPLGVIPRSIVPDVQFAGANGHELRVLITARGGTPGANAEILRSPIERKPDGTACDIAAIVVGNHFLLRTTLRPILQVALGLDDAGFDRGHPCHWWGSTQMPAEAKVVDMIPSIDAVHGGIDGDGRIVTSMAFSVTHATGAFGVNGSLQVAFGASVEEQSPTRRVLRLSMGTSLFTGIDIWIAGWAYAVAAFVAPLAALIGAFLDAFAGGELRGQIDGAIHNAITKIIDPTQATYDADTCTVELPLPPAPVPVPETDLTQSGPPHMWYSERPELAGIILADYPENDAIITFS